MFRILAAWHPPWVTGKRFVRSRRLEVCVVAGDALSVGAQSALADIRGLGVPLGWEGEKTRTYVHVCMTTSCIRACMNACMYACLACLSVILARSPQPISFPPTLTWLSRAGVGEERVKPASPLEGWGGRGGGGADRAREPGSCVALAGPIAAFFSVLATCRKNRCQRSSYVPDPCCMAPTVGYWQEIRA